MGASSSTDLHFWCVSLLLVHIFLFLLSYDIVESLTLFFELGITLLIKLHVVCNHGQTLLRGVHQVLIVVMVVRRRYWVWVLSEKLSVLPWP